MRESIHISQFDGHAREAAEVWRFTKVTRVAIRSLWTQPSGGEGRVTVDGEWQAGEAGRDGLALLDLALQWKEQFQAKGWQ